MYKGRTARVGWIGSAGGSLDANEAVIVVQVTKVELRKYRIDFDTVVECHSDEGPGLDMQPGGGQFEVGKLV